MPDYGFAFQQATLSTSYKTAGVIGPSSGVAPLRRVRIFEFSVGQGTPNATDSAIQWDMSRVTAWTTYAASTGNPSPVDPADTSAQALANQNFSAEPAYASASAGLDIWNLTINQRAAYRWIAKDGKEIVIPAVTSGGVGFRALAATPSGYASLGGGSAFFSE